MVQINPLGELNKEASSDTGADSSITVEASGSVSAFEIRRNQASALATTSAKARRGRLSIITAQLHPSAAELGLGTGNSGTTDGAIGDMAARIIQDAFFRKKAGHDPLRILRGLDRSDSSHVPGSLHIAKGRAAARLPHDEHGRLYPMNTPLSSFDAFGVEWATYMTFLTYTGRVFFAAAMLNTSNLVQSLAVTLQPLCIYAAITLQPRCHHTVLDLQLIYHACAFKLPSKCHHASTELPF